MAFAFVASATNFDGSGAGTILDTTSTSNLVAGDLLVAVARWEDSDVTATIAQSTGGNVLTMLNRVVNSTYQTIGYKLAAAADVAATMRMTLSGAGSDWRYFAVLQFRPTALPTLDTSNGGATGSSTAPVSQNINTAEADELVVGVVTTYASTTFSSIQIGDGAADGSVIVDTPGGSQCTTIFYKATTADGIHAQVTLDGSTAWTADILSFKIAGAGGRTVMVTRAKPLGVASGMNFGVQY